MIVVTGGAGFIGSALIWQLNLLGREDILVVDQLGEDERWANLRALNYLDYMDKVEFIDLVRTRRLPGSVETVLHMGACSDTSERDADYLVQNNFSYTKSLIEYAVEQGVRLVYASSAATYGDGAQGYLDNELLLPKLRPLNMYGYSKHMTDVWAWRQGMLSNVAGVKFSNVFGPNEYHKGQMRSLVDKAFQQITQTGKVQLFKSYRPEYVDGGQVRDFIYVKDAVSMTLHLADRHGANGIFNIGAGCARSWNDLASAVFQALDRPVKIEYIEMPESLRGRYQYHTELEVDKLRETGWTASPGKLEDGVTDYVRNYLRAGKYLGEE